MAARGIEPAGVRAMLGLTPTGEREELPEADVSAAELPGGWSLLYFNRSGHRAARDPVLERLSREGEVVACDLDENTVCCTTEGWSAGRRAWAVSHDSGRGRKRLQTSGEPPGCLAPLRARALAELKAAAGDVDYVFDVPVGIAAELTGFRHDRLLTLPDPLPFHVLADALHCPAVGDMHLSGLNLTVENEPEIPAPALSQVYAAVDWLTPRGGPSFAVLEGPGGDYVQTAGGDGAYTVEWREYPGAEFRHFVAGHPGVPDRGSVGIRTNGYQVKVRPNERLAVEEVKSLFAAFARGEARPESFAWRETTREFRQ